MNNIQVIDVKEFQAKIDQYEKRLKNSKQFFDNVTEMFRAKYNDRDAGRAFAVMAEDNIIGYINDCLDKLEKVTGQPQEKIKFDSKLYF